MDSLTREQITQQIYTVAEFEIEETIYKSDTFPDATYERFYRLKHPGGSDDLGKYSDESGNGISIPPQQVGAGVAVYSSAHLFFWQPDEETVHFWPYRVDGWSEFAKPCNLNGHYDYRAQEMTIENGRWLITYECTSCTATKPSTILFVSEDAGQSFEMGTNSSCTD